MILRRLIAPASEPITLEEAKLHCKIDTDDDDSLVEALITAAREYCETFQRRAYITQTWEMWLDRWPRLHYMMIPRPPLVGVDLISWFDADDVETAFSPGEYMVDTMSEPGWVVLNRGASWPSESLRPAIGVRIQFTCGYGDAADVPQQVKQAMLLILAAWYEQREDFISTGAVPKEIPFGASALLWQERNW